MNRIPLTRLLLAASFCTASGIALAQGTTSGTTPTNPAPETMGSTPSTMSKSDSSMSTGTMPTKAECDKMMADHKKMQSSSSSSSSMSMDSMDKTKMKQCEDMKKSK